MKSRATPAVGAMAESASQIMVDFLPRPGGRKHLGEGAVSGARNLPLELRWRGEAPLQLWLGRDHLQREKFWVAQTLPEEVVKNPQATRVTLLSVMLMKCPCSS